MNKINTLFPDEKLNESTSKNPLGIPIDGCFECEVYIRDISNEYHRYDFGNNSLTPVLTPIGLQKKITSRRVKKRRNHNN